MLGKHKKRLKELKARAASFKWDIEEIKFSDMDPMNKAIWISDAEYEHLNMLLEIDELEHYIAMFPLKLMFAGFTIFVIAMTIYMLS